MNNNLPSIVREDTFLVKCLNFIKSLFKKKEKNIYINNSDKEDNPFLKEKYRIKEFSQMNDSDKINEKIIEEKEEKDEKDEITEMIQMVEENPETLDKLEIQQLEKINNYYTNQIEECKKKIEKMDRYINNVSMTNVVVGKTNDGSKNITLADIWPDDEKTRN